jgi:hypothetical protein
MSPGIRPNAGMGSPPIALWLGLTWLGLTCVQFSDDNRDVSRNAGSIAVPVPVAAARPMKSYGRLRCSSAKPLIQVK